MKKQKIITTYTHKGEFDLPDFKTPPINPQDALRIAMCESSLNPKARNPTSSAKGLYGFLDGTWQWIKAPMTQEDTYWSVVMFMKYYKKYPHYWECK